MNQYATQVKQAWTAWQQANAAEAAQIRTRFATKAIEHGFTQAERYLILAIMERLQVSYADVSTALS